MQRIMFLLDDSPPHSRGSGPPQEAEWEQGGGVGGSGLKLEIKV